MLADHFRVENAGRHRKRLGQQFVSRDGWSGVLCVLQKATLAAGFCRQNFYGKQNLNPLGRDTLYWDFGTSPVLTEKHVVMALMREGNLGLLAYDKQTGKLAWKTERNYKTPR